MGSYPNMRFLMRRLLDSYGAAPRFPEYVLVHGVDMDHVSVYIYEPEHPEDLVPAEDEAPIEAYITEVASAPPPPPSFLPSLIRPPPDIPEADTPPQKRLLLTAPRPGCEVRESYAAVCGDSQGPTMLVGSIAVRALEARVTVLETEMRRHEWQRQAADDLAVQHIMRTQALEAGACVDTLEDTSSSS
ncbi:hypothetical protein Tco_0862652 [Tanacetum coccineum]